MAAKLAHLSRPVSTARVLTALTLSLALGACSGGLNGTTTAALGDEPPLADKAAPQGDLERAIEHWGREHAKAPRNKAAALNYARNLKAAGQKQAALEVMQGVAMYHGQDREIASEYGRLALEMNQAGLAGSVLAIADDPSKPDWKVISARGSAYAKLGQFDQAVPMFERALQISPDNPSVQNNLAMAYAANGDPNRAELLLRRAHQARPEDARIRQNLAIVLGLLGRFEEAKAIGGTGVGGAEADNNVEMMRRIVRLPGKEAPAPVPTAAAPLKPAKTAKVALPAVPAAPTTLSDSEADRLIQQAIAAAKDPAQTQGPAVAGWSKKKADPAAKPAAQ
jgi:Flp pilus assembly protein TadD